MSRPRGPSTRCLRAALNINTYVSLWKLPAAIIVVVVTMLVYFLIQTFIANGGRVTQAFYRHHVKEEGDIADMETRLSSSIVSHIAYWNTQPDALRYHAADRFSPHSRSCNCYAPWLNQTVQETCYQVETLAGNARECFQINIASACTECAFPSSPDSLFSSVLLFLRVKSIYGPSF